MGLQVDVIAAGIWQLRCREGSDSVADMTGVGKGLRRCGHVPLGHL